MLDIVNTFKKNISILIKLLPLFSFIIPFILLYFLYPKSFEGDPSWEGYWQGRFFYIFFLWLASLEMILSWEELQTNKVNKLRHRRTVAFIVALLLPVVYVIAANYCGLNAIIADLAEQSNVPHARLMPLVAEYLVFAVVFCLVILLAYGINRLTDFSISVFFLGIIGLLYTIDNLYPVGRFTPFQMIVPTTATLAANVLNLMGYKTSMSFISNHPTYGSMPYLKVKDSLGNRAEFGIAWPCAGVESLLIYTLTILLFLKKTDVPWKQKIIYFVIGAIVTYFINILRVVAIFVVKINGGEWLRFHNIYGPLFSIIWITSYPLIIIGSRILWRKIRC